MFLYASAFRIAQQNTMSLLLPLQESSQPLLKPVFPKLSAKHTDLKTDFAWFDFPSFQYNGNWKTIPCNAKVKLGGSYQSFLYFKPVIDEILSEFKFAPEIQLKAKNALQRINVS